MEKKWIIKDSPDEGLIDDLCKSINVSPPVATILLQRGLENFESAKNFFRPSLQGLHDPFLMKDMKEAVDVLYENISSKKKILIYGDYDVDGTTSVALVYQYLSRITDNIEFYIPDRYTEGYGVSEKGMDHAVENGFSLIITLDCGIKAINTLQIPHQAGLDVIVCDHHLPGNELPLATAVLDPKRSDCKYPFKELSGCGVGFKLLQGIYLKYKLNIDPLEFIDYVAVSIAADIVPIIEENRILTYYGIKKLSESPSPGLKALLDLSGRKFPLDVNDIVFGIAPRINAAGRIKHANAAVELLISQDENEAKELASVVNGKNEDRRKVDSIITEEALAMIEQNAHSQLAKSTVLFKQDWHKGVIGIVASRCIEKFYRPTIILTESNNKATGSARSIQGFDVYKAIESCSDLLEQYGGHTHAAGLTMDIANVALFQKRFEEVVAKELTNDLLVPPLEIDLEIDFDKITTNFFKVLMQMAPFGPCNLSPVFLTKGLKAGGIKILSEKHIKFTVEQNSNTLKFEVIGFNMAHQLEKIQSGTPFDMVYSLELNDYMGVRSIQLVVKDIREQSK